ncbi:unnamed protein product, partial [Polarella glacialis]
MAGATATPGVFRVKCDAEVRQAPSITSPLFHKVAAGKQLGQMGRVVTLADGTQRVPLIPRGWIDAAVLESLDGKPFESSEVSLSGLPTGRPVVVDVVPKSAEEAEDLQDEKGLGGPVKAKSKAKAAAASKKVDRPVAAEDAPTKVPTATSGVLTFRVKCTAEVRQAPSKESALFNSVYEGTILTQMGPAITLAGGVRRIPLRPRGWIDASVLEPMAAGDQDAVPETSSTGAQELWDAARARRVEEISAASRETGSQ